MDGSSALQLGRYLPTVPWLLENLDKLLQTLRHGYQPSTR